VNCTAYITLNVSGVKLFCHSCLASIYSIFLRVWRKHTWMVPFPYTKTLTQLRDDTLKIPKTNTLNTIHKRGLPFRDQNINSALVAF